MAMKKLLFLFVTVMCTISCSTTDADMFWAIDGVVVEEESNQPLEGVNVSLIPSGKNYLTDSTGHFLFEELEAEQYTVTGQKSGYASDIIHINAVHGGTVYVTITMKSNQ